VSVVDNTGDSIVAIEARRDVQTVVRNANFVDDFARNAILIGELEGGFAVEGGVFFWENEGPYFGRICGEGGGSRWRLPSRTARSTAREPRGRTKGGKTCSGRRWRQKVGCVGTEGIVCFELPAFLRDSKSPA
jgi:hypothetical protein